MGDLPERQALHRRKTEHENEGKGDCQQDRIGTGDRYLGETGESAMLALLRSVRMIAALFLAGDHQLHGLETVRAVRADRNSQHRVA